MVNPIESPIGPHWVPNRFQSDKIWPYEVTLEPDGVTWALNGYLEPKFRSLGGLMRSLGGPLRSPEGSMISLGG